ncbi:MAG: helix-turn-helix transcriptional regulator [Acidobacteria bacterium]|nr:helix-turn-helix transcriptional regulator [Acidobacteriota bacterium]
MIKNEKEYRVTKAAAQKFQDALTNFDERPAAHPGIDPHFIPKMRESIESELEILSDELKTYEQLQRRRRNKLKVAELRSLPLELIRARISAGLSEADLAKRLGLKPQQIHRYEEHDYETASFARILEIAQAIEQAVHERV